MLFKNSLLPNSYIRSLYIYCDIYWIILDLLGNIYEIYANLTVMTALFNLKPFLNDTS